MNPAQEYLKKLYLEKPEVFSNTEGLKDYLDNYGSYGFASEESLQTTLDGIDFKALSTVSEPEVEKKKDLLSPGTELQSTGEQEESSSVLRSKADSVRVKNILNFIGDSESKNDPNRFRDDHVNGEMGKFDFTNMSIGEVLSWQESNKDSKGRYRAVGQYQFMPETLKEFAEKAGLKVSDKFSKENQEKLTIAMLEEGGLSDFLKDPDGNKERFSNTLARRFASMPLLYNTNVNGKVKKRGESRYGGMNEALVNPVALEEILDVIPDIIQYKDGKNASDYYKELEAKLERRKPFGGITTKFLEDQLKGLGDETDVYTELTRLYGNMGFQFKQADNGGNAIVITAPNGESSGEIILPGFQDSVEDFAQSPLAFIGLKDYEKETQSERTLTQAAKRMRTFLSENYDDPITAYYNQFRVEPINTSAQIFQKYVTITPSQVDSAALDVKALRLEQKNLNKFIPGAPGTQTYGKINPEWQAIEDKIKEKKGIISNRDKQIKRGSEAVAKLLDEMGGVDFFLKNVEHGHQYVSQLVERGFLDPLDINTKAITVDGQPASYNFLRRVLTDFDMRQSYYDGEFSIELDSSALTASDDSVSKAQREVFKMSEKLMEKQLHDGTFFGKDGKLPYYMEQMVAPILASGLDLGINTAHALQDIIATPIREYNRYYLKKSLDEEFHDDIDTYVENIYNPHYSEVFQNMRESVREVRDQIPETAGGMVDSQGVREFFLKGGQAAGESAPIMAMFALAPGAALATTGFSVYGQEHENYMEMMDMVQGMDPTRATLDAEGYMNLTHTKARGLSLAKGVGEAFVTGAFTYQYLKGLSKATKSAGNVSHGELKDLVRAYGRSFTQKASEYSKGLKVEAIEENIIGLNNMFVDDISGTQNYEFSDYVNMLKETSLSTLFTTAPLTAAAMNRKSSAATDFVRNHISERLMHYDEATVKDMEQYNTLTALIDEKGVENVSDVVKENVDKLAQSIVQRHDEMRDLFLKNAKDEDVRQIVERDLEIQELGRQYKKAETQPEKDAIKARVEKEYEKFKVLKDRIDPKNILRAQTDLETVVQEYKKDKEGEEQQVETPAETPLDQAMRKAASNLEALGVKYTEGDIDESNVFVRKPEMFDEVITWLKRNNESGLGNHTQREVTEFLRRFSGGNKNFENEVDTAFEGREVQAETKIEDFYNRVVLADKVVQEIQAAKPAEVGKINPFTAIEGTQISPLFGGKLRMATNDHVITFMLKNSQMAQPLIRISNEIDSGMAKAIAAKTKIQADYDKLSFLGDKVSKKRRKDYFSRENETERAFLSYLQKDLANGNNYLQKKQSLKQHLQEQLDNANTSQQKQIIQEQIDVFNRVVEPATTLEMLDQTAGKDNVEGVRFMRQLFEDLNKDNRVIHHMTDMVGNRATLFKNYMPTVFEVNNTPGETVQLDQINTVPGQFEETSDQINIPSGAKLIIENFDNIMFNAYQNSLSHLNTAGAMARYDGVLNSEKFKQLFDTETEFKHGPHQKNKFEHATDILKQKTAKVRQIQRSAKSQVLEKNVLNDIARVAGKVVAVKRLATLDMPLKQAYSAMLAALPNMGNTARGFLIGRMARFNVGVAKRINDAHAKILGESLTQTRGGLSEFTSEYLDALKFRESKQSMLLDVPEKTADFMMEKLLGSSDKVAGVQTFLAYYMDYDLRNNPEARKIDVSIDNYDKYWDWAQNNINRDAIAYADNQVDRSQTQTSPWNQGGAFGANPGDMNKTLSQILFLFGRFAYNRKVGIANDVGILNSDSAASQDKSRAKRRLTSAAIEIGVFKAMSPIFGIMFQEAFTGMIGSLLGVDEELDKQIEILQRSQQTPGLELAKYYTSNYRRNISKEFTTSLVESFIPVPTPQVVNSLGMAVANASFRQLGVTDDDVFNLYGDTYRRLSEGTLGPMDEDAIANFLISNSGLLELGAQDVKDLYNDINYLATGNVNKFKGLGSDRMIMDQGKKAADILAISNIMNTLIVPSGDVARFNRQLRKVLYRDFTVADKRDKLIKPKE